MKTLPLLVGAALIAVGTTTPVGAHHSFSMFDNSKEQVLAGEIVRWAFNSPHTVVQIKGREGDGVEP